MITIACTNCQTLLTMDEAFAGGVCRCQHCGTIQTVPSHLKKGATAGASAGQAVGTSKSLYQQSRASTDAASGLEALGDAVTSSGLGSARLKAPPRTYAGGASVDQGAGKSAKNPLVVPLIIAVAALLLIVILLVIFLAKHSGNPSGGSVATGNGGGAGGTSSTIGGSTGTVAPVTGPSFLGVSVKGENVVYLIDRSGASMNYFDSIKGAVINSLHSLGSDHYFQVKFWDNTDKSVAQAWIPPVGTQPAQDMEIHQVSNAIEDLTAGGTTTLASGLNDTVKHRPDAIVIVTSKSEDQFSDDDAKALQKAAGAHIPLYLFEVGDNPPLAAFQSAATASGGASRAITVEQLRQLVP